MMSDFTAVVFILIVLMIVVIWLCILITLCRYNGFYTYHGEKEITDDRGNRLTPSGWVEKGGGLIGPF